MENFAIQVNTGTILGAMKRLNGGNLAPKIYANRRAYNNINEDFKALKLPITRLHDAPLENPAMRLVDIPLIFPQFHADENDARNYYFEQTDDYIENCLDCGCSVIYRLGVSIEHGKKRYFVNPPEDYAKWARICINIIRHYNEGLWNGHYWNIQYWEIWNEPMNNDPDGLPKMWGGTEAEFNDFYCETAKLIKNRFPHLKIGGPSHGLGNGEPNGPTEIFLKKCAETGAPVDFYSWHCYCDSIKHYVEQVAPIRRMADQCGFPHAELHLNEWHYFPIDWEKDSSDVNYHRWFYSPDGFKGLDSAAFLCAVMTQWQDTPLDMGGYYTVTATSYGLFEQFSVPTKSYFGMKAFGEIALCPQRFEVLADAPVYALGGTDRQGNGMILLSLFQSGASSINLNFDTQAAIQMVYLLDDEKNLESIPFIQDKQHLELALHSQSGVILIQFKHNEK